MKRSIAIAGAVVVVCMLTIYSVFYLPYGIGYMRTMKKHCEEAKREIAAVEFTGENRRCKGRTSPYQIGGTSFVQQGFAGRISIPV